jgi:leader peptidase (prepilin peptidase)/N-methyltransferase
MVGFDIIFFYVFYLFICGLLIGSFLNVVAIRVLKKESISFPPSHCVHCDHRLHSKDLIPVFSYIWLRGKCRYCREPISSRYPIGELCTGLLFMFGFLVIGLDKELVAALFFIGILVVITQTDLQEMTIPNSVVLTGIIGAILIRIWTHPYPLWNYLIAFFVGSGILFLLGWIWEKLLKREAMGGGDIKLYAFIGLILGIEITILSLFLASVLGLLFGIIQIVRNRQQVQASFAFGPFIAGGSLIAYLWGGNMINWYLGLL